MRQPAPRTSARATQTETRALGAHTFVAANFGGELLRFLDKGGDGDA
jgi:hypothetical protein